MALSKDSLKRLDSLDFDRFKQEVAQLPDSIQGKIFERQARKRMRVQTEFAAYDLNEIVKTYLQNTRNSNDLKQALLWSNRIVELVADPSYLNLNAQLLIKLGLIKKAIERQKQAINQAELFKKEPEEFRDSLKKMLMLK